MTLEKLLQIGKQEGIPTAEENNQLATRAKHDPEALDELVRRNIRLILKCVNQYRAQSSLDDMFQEGVIGFCNAVNNYDETKSGFTTHAYYWMRAYILRANLSMEEFHYEQRFYTLMIRYKQMHEKIDLLGITDDELTEEELLSYKLTKSDLAKIQRYKRTSCSLDNFYSEEKEKDKHFDIPDTSTCTEDSAVSQAFQAEVQRELSKSLSKREYLILCSYYGIGYEYPLSNDETGKLLMKQFGSKSFTRSYLQAVRQRALNKLKKNRKLQELFIA